MSTPSPSALNAKQIPVTQLTGIGPRTAVLLNKLGITSLQDLLLHLPYRYEDRTRIHSIAELRTGVTAFVCGRVELAEVVVKTKKSLVCRINDDTGFLYLRFFHFSAAQLQALTPGSWLTAYAEVRLGFAGLEMVHPDYKILANRDEITADEALTPVYALTEGLSQHTLRKAIKHALSWLTQRPELLPDCLPTTLIEAYCYPALIEALNALHAPKSIQAPPTADHPARKRLALEELLAHHLALRQVRQYAKTATAPQLTPPVTVLTAFLDHLPFALTGAQQRVIKEIEHDVSSNKPMLRLVQGDVGSGKTVVAAYTALLALGSGYQVALMAPTELLAEQHFRTFTSWLGDSAFPVVLLTGQSKSKHKETLLQTLAIDSPILVVGTHALFQQSVQFSRLGLIIIDEQHRFGVHQRLALREKAQNTGLKPHQLVMTATPIPRTLAMLQYSDLDISIIDELPPGRIPIVTSVIPSERREEVINRIQHWIDQRRQAYWVCTLIEESELLQCQAAENTALLLAQSLPAVRVGLVHGRMKARDKEHVMQAFKQHELDLLVATTVIEVGVDVPNAGLMIIENPERLGLAQLHQLRGRVGRGQSESFCLLLYQMPLSQLARQRLKILRDSHDGFYIAEQDLQLRGPGDVMGTRQTGQMQFKIADLQQDAELFEFISMLSDHLLRDFPELITPICQRWLEHAGLYAEV